MQHCALLLLVVAFGGGVFDEHTHTVAKQFLLNPHQKQKNVELLSKATRQGEVCDTHKICKKKRQDLAFTRKPGSDSEEQNQEGETVGGASTVDSPAHPLFDNNWEFTQHAIDNSFKCVEAESVVPTVRTYALMTLADDGFMPGLLVMLNSFVDHNPWFLNVGEVVIPYTSPEKDTHRYSNLNVHLSDANRRLLHNVFNGSLQFQFLEIDPAVYVRAMVGQNLGRLARSIFKLEALSPSYASYDKLVFLDADMVVVGGLRILFDLPSTKYQFAAAKDDWKACSEAEACAAQPLVEV